MSSPTSKKSPEEHSVVSCDAGHQDKGVVEAKVAYKRYLLGVLLVIYALNSVDRLALGLMLQDIKLDLGLSDTQLGLLTGIAFALFYSVMGIPIAHWADRGNRITIISIATGLWSAAVAISGLATSFIHLLLIRVGVAVGEAGCVPTAHSLIADYFSRAERPRATAIFQLGVPISAIIGYFVAGWLNEIYGWRTTFVLLGIPGIVLALLTFVTLKEPRRSTPRGAESRANNVNPSMVLVWSTLWGNRTFRQLLLAFSIVCLFGFGISKWQAAFFMRSYGLKTGELGTWFAIIFGSAGLIGTWLGGEWAFRSAAGNERLQLRAMAVAFVCFAFIKAWVFLAPNLYMAFTFMALANVGYSMAMGPLFATVQTLVPNNMRAMSFALIYLFSNLIGMGFGPLAAGMLSDAFLPWAGAESLRYALLALCPGYLLAAWHLTRASKTVSQDIAASAAARSSDGS